MKRSYSIRMIVLTEEVFDYHTLAQAAADGLREIMLKTDTPLRRRIACVTTINTTCKGENGRSHLDPPEGGVKASTPRSSRSDNTFDDGQYIRRGSVSSLNLDLLDTEFYKTLLPKRR